MQSIKRAEQDFFTNPYFAILLQKIEEQERKETESLKAAGREDSTANFNHQTGVVDGIDRVKMLIKNEHNRVTNDK